MSLWPSSLVSERRGTKTEPQGFAFDHAIRNYTAGGGLLNIDGHDLESYKLPRRTPRMGFSFTD